MKKISYLVLSLCIGIVLSGCSSNESKDADTPSSTKESQVAASSSNRSSAASTANPSSTSTQSMETRAAQSTNSQPKKTTMGYFLSDAQKSQVNQAFLEWAGQRAVMGNMAVSDWYFDHGAAGHGDWYADTPDGQVQVQDFGVPGKTGFPIHAIGGCIFYTSKDGSVGKQDLYAGSFAANYSIKLDDSKPVSKYLLGDNGVVYELKTGNGIAVSTNTGFGEYADDGTQGTYRPDQMFLISEDHAAQEKLQELIASYQ